MSELLSKSKRTEVKTDSVTAERKVVTMAIQEVD